jgi:hypothetical protein
MYDIAAFPSYVDLLATEWSLRPYVIYALCFLGNTRVTELKDRLEMLQY